MAPNAFRPLSSVLAAAALTVAAGVGPAAPAQAAAPALAAETTVPSLTTDPATLPARWSPRVGLSWQIQFSGALNTSLAVDAYDLDGEDTAGSVVTALAARNVKAICYISAGSWEDWRADAASFPAGVLGKNLDGWAGERWLDVRRIDVLMPLMRARMQACKAKGFAAVDADNVDGYTNDTGFPLTGDHQLAYIRALALEAHRLGLAYGLKNNVEQVAQLARDVDFAVNEQCERYRECGAYTSLISAGKPVLHIEYAGTLSKVCANRPATFSTLRKNLSLDAYRRAC